MTLSILDNSLFVILVSVVGGLLLILLLVSRWYRKASQGQALVKTGFGGVKVSFNGMFVIPVFQRLEIMDISLKSVVIPRMGKDGLICKDNMRADIKVAFFVRVNQNSEDVKKVAQAVGCARASSKEALVQLFEAKFSEALKTVGKQLNFIELYTSREDLKVKLIETIGKDLNGYILDDAAIDYLEQTPLDSLDADNILDAEGIKKITDITARENMEANAIRRNEEKVIKQQDVEAREAILELERQLAETEEKQKREIATVTAREEAETAKVQSEERKKAEFARIATEEEVQIAEENKQRQVLVAAKNKERTEAVETERVEKDRALEATERERIVTLAQIEKEKAVEEERKNIQEVIRERVAIEKTVVDEEERIKDTRAIAEANRNKTVAVTAAEQAAEESLVQEIKKAEAAKQASEFHAKQLLIEAEAEQASSTQRAEAIKILADAKAAEESAIGKAEAQVMEAKAQAIEKQGEAEAAVIEAKAEAEAKGIELTSHAQATANLEIGKAEADVERQKGLAEAEVIAAIAESDEKKGLIDAKVMQEKFNAEARGIEEKAEAMKKLDGVGKDHEEFKLRLDKEKAVELAEISIQRDIAEAQARVLGTALESAKIDIVGGEATFFDKIISAITNGKQVERFIDNSSTISTVKSQLLNEENGTVMEQVQQLLSGSDISSDDLKNLSIAALLMRLHSEAKDEGSKGALSNLLDLARQAGVADLTPSKLGIEKK